MAAFHSGSIALLASAPAAESCLSRIAGQRSPVHRPNRPGVRRGHANTLRRWSSISLLIGGVTVLVIKRNAP
jgi:hypothetical protein